MKPFLSLAFLLSLCVPAGAQLIPPGSIWNCPIIAYWNPPNQIQVDSAAGGLRITWIPSAGEPTAISGFEIARAASLDGPYRLIGLVNGSDNEFIDREVPPGEFFFYRVRAVSYGRCTPFSEPMRGMR